MGLMMDTLAPTVAVLTDAVASTAVAVAGPPDSSAAFATTDAPTATMTMGPTEEEELAAELDFMRRSAIRRRMNEQTILVYIIALLAMMMAFIAFHLVRRFGAWAVLGQQQRTKTSAMASLSRKIRSVANRSMSGLPAAGYSGVIFIYAGLNVAATFANLDNNNMRLITNVASRTAWLAMVNMVVLVVLALKNTPLAFLSAWSYERLNVLHQVAGYMTIVCTVVHGSCYSAYFVQGGRTAVLLQMKEVYGMIAASSFLIIGFAGAVLRRRWYELFYYVHVVFWVLSVVMIGLHQPNVSLRIVTATLLAGCIWSADRIIRSTRLMLYCVNNAVTLTPLANGATRVTMAKAPIGAESGKHAFLWIPKIRAFETHPFTIAALGPMEFVINSHDGFTRDLHMYAVSNPGARLWASVEGSYGQIPDPATFDTVVLVAGGSGASFTFGMALNLLHKMRSDENKRVIFVWIVKSYEYLDWYADHLRTLGSDSRIDVRLCVTRRSASEMTTPRPSSPVVEVEMQRMARVQTTTTRGEKGPAGRPPQSSSTSVRSAKSEASLDEAPSHMHSIPVLYQRPDVNDIIRGAVEDTPSHRRVLVLGCGPDGLMNKVRDTTAACMRSDGPAVELHCEQFGW